jgi:hypothetical protein
MDDFKSFAYHKTEEFTPNITAKCIVHFRPKKDWKGEDYGFDWMRVGDTGVFGDTKPYEEIVCKQYTSSAANAALETNINAYKGDFRKNSDLYNKLCTEGYKWLTILPHPPLAGRPYFCSWLSLYPESIKVKKPKSASEIMAQKTFSLDSLFTTENKPSGYSANTEAELRLYLEMEEKPDYLEFEDNEHFEITDKKINGGLKNGFLNKTVKIKCKMEFDTDQSINIYACKKNKETGKDDKKLAGRLWVWANGKWRRKVATALLVKVITPPIISTGSELEGKTANQSTYFEKYLSQAFIKVNIEDVNLDLSADPEFKNGTGFVNGGIINYKKEIGLIFKTSLIEYLDKKLQKQLKKDGKDKHLYDNLFKAYYFGNKGTNGSNGVGGYYDPDTGNVVIFGNPNAITAPHEFLHKFCLSHSFANSECSNKFQAKCTYKALETENLMDYSFPVNGKDQYALWHWQWEVANNNA